MKAKKKAGKYDQLTDRASVVMKHAYAPYSKLKVGAALLTLKGNIFTGCNVENASFGLTCCAERNAIFKAVAEEGPTMKIEAIAIAVNTTRSIPPCGACRQVIAEFRDTGKNGTTVIFNSHTGRVSRKIEQLLPDSFILLK
jgi:cytidine deaminase